MQLRFPLPTDYFARFELLPAEAQSYQSQATAIVRETRRELEHYVPEGRNKIDSRTWKLARSKDRLHCYRRRSSKGKQQLGLYGPTDADQSVSSSISSSDSSVPYGGLSHSHASARSSSSSHSRSGYDAKTGRSVTSRSSEGERSRKCLKPGVIGYGLLDGTVDDLVYGLLQSSTEEMKTLAAFLGDDSLIDCAVLHSLKKSRASYLGLKWKLQRTVGGNRDVCYLEHTGVALDDRGERFGYHVLESVPVATCPVFEDNSIVRTQLSFCYIFRPGKLPEQVEVFMQGAFDSSADVLTAGGVGDYRSAMDMLFTLDMALAGAEAKKLSAMVARHSGAQRAGGAKHESGGNCSICRAKAKLLSSHSACQTCGATICHKCRVRKTTFSRRGKIKLLCCKLCMVMVKDQSPFAGERLESLAATFNAKSVKRASSRSSERRGSDRSHQSGSPPVDKPGGKESTSTMSLTDSEFSVSYASTRSVSATGSDGYEDSNGMQMALGSSATPERKMAAVLERAPPPPVPGHEMVLHTYESEQRRRYEQQQHQQQQFMQRQRAQQDQGTSREGLYNQMRELQLAAERAYNLTNQNASMMH